KSTGLGLMIVKKIVDAHNAEISVSSEVGKGSCFTVKLPIKKLEIQGDIARDDMNQKIPHDKDDLNIVVVDDDVMMRTLSEVIFNKIGGNITMLEDAEALLDQVDSINPDLVFTDINMPGMNGYDLAKQIRDKGINVPIFGLTGFIDDEVQTLSKNSGMDGLYEKPPMENMLKHIIAQVYEERMG
ncbi:MAG: response regulator, partial [Flavobacteriaceae bacterium]